MDCINEAPFLPGATQIALQYSIPNITSIHAHIPKPTAALTLQGHS
jgi:hypothetical protein